MRRILFLVTLVAASTARAADVWTGPPVLVTTGQAEVRATPDRAVVRLATEARAPSAKAAQQQDAQAMAALQKVLADAHVPAEAIRTLSYDLQQEFDYPQGKQVPRGFVARHTLEVRVDDLPGLGDLLGKAVESGAASVSNIQFDVKARDDLERQALRKAVEDARARAEGAAAGATTSVTGVIRIEEQRPMEPPPPRPMAFRNAVAAEAVATPIAAGEIEIRSTVTLTSALK
jgi:uncharacterized protein YggE